MNTCKFICEKLKHKKSFQGRDYDNGRRWCKNCSIFLKFADSYCPCCGIKMRYKPRKSQTNEIKAQRKAVKKVYVVINNDGTVSQLMK